MIHVEYQDGMYGCDGYLFPLFFGCFSMSRFDQPDLEVYRLLSCQIYFYYEARDPRRMQ